MEKYRDTALSPEERAADLLRRMTADEKIYQLSAQLIFDYSEEYHNKRDYRHGNYRNPGHFMHQNPNIKTNSSEVAHAINEDVRNGIAASRFGIPPLENGEALHGAQWGMATVFPQPIAMASTFDPELMAVTADIIGKECAAVGVRQVFAPVINIVRDCRWGRTVETFGEDVLLTADMGVAMCRGLQRNGVIATPKHFVDNYADGGRDSNESHSSIRTLREVYLEPFRRCFRDGNAMSVMAAYNGIDGLPCSCNNILLTDILRNEWGFDGFVVSDYSGVEGVSDVHRIVNTREQGQALCLRAGLDVTLPWETDTVLREALTKGLITEDDLNRAVLRVLTAKIRIGLFDHPFVEENLSEQIVRCDAHKAVALKGARESIVLLKNNGILPINTPKVEKIGIFGPGADLIPIGQNYSGPYGGWRAEDVDTPLSYIRKYVVGKKIEIVTGTDEEIPQLAPSCDACFYFTSILEGEGKDRSNIHLSSERKQGKRLADVGGYIVDNSEIGFCDDPDGAICKMIAVNPRSGVILLNGAPVDMSAWIDDAATVLEAWYPGEAGARAIIEVMFGEVSPSGKLPITFPRTVGQLPLYYAHKTSGRGYGYNENDGSPLFEFGFGLSYSHFEITEIRPIFNGNNLSVEMDICNSGKMDAAEVVQIYLQGTNCHVMRPICELKGYRRVNLKVGEKKHILVPLDEEAFCFYNAEMVYGMFDGDYIVNVGTSCKNIVHSFSVLVRDGVLQLG